MTTPADQPDLIAFLRGEVDTDEDDANACLATVLTPGPAREWAEQAILEAEAKRRILARCEQAYREQGIYGEDGQEQLADDLLRLLALPYADRPGYRDEWRP